MRLAVENVGKSFPGVVALDGVSVALVGARTLEQLRATLSALALG